MWATLVRPLVVAAYITVFLVAVAALPWAIRTAANYWFPEDELVGRECPMSDGRKGEMVRSGFFRAEYCRALRK